MSPPNHTCDHNGANGSVHGHIESSESTAIIRSGLDQSSKSEVATSEARSGPSLRKPEATSPPTNVVESPRVDQYEADENDREELEESTRSTGTAAPLHRSLSESRSSSSQLSSEDCCAPTPVMSNRRPDLYPPLQRLPAPLSDLLTPPCLTPEAKNGRSYTPRSNSNINSSSTGNNVAALSSDSSNTERIECRFSSDTEDPIVMTIESMHQSKTEASDSRRKNSRDKSIGSTAASRRTMCLPSVSMDSPGSNPVQPVALFVELTTWLSFNMAPMLYRTVRQSIVHSLQQPSTDPSSTSRRRDTKREQHVQGLSSCNESMMQKSTSMSFSWDDRSAHVGKSSVRGIPNYGQTCFLNSVLQALASSESFSLYLQQVVERNEERHSFQSPTWMQTDDLIGILPYQAKPVPPLLAGSVMNQESQPNTDASIAEALLNVLNLVNGHEKNGRFGDKSKIDPRSILRAVGRKHKQFQASYGAVTNADQQDAQELLQAVLDMVVDEGQFEITPLVLAKVADGVESDDLSVSLAGELFGIRRKGSKPRDTRSTLHATSSLKHNGVHELPSAKCESKASLGLAEEKKQEEFEVHVPREFSEENLSRLMNHALANHALLNGSTDKGIGCNTVVSEPSRQTTQPPTYSSKAVEIMMTTTSSISPCPLTGWCGSTLWCAACRRVRPMQNVPFLDIPIVPTSVSQSMSFPSKLAGARAPPCKLEECLKEYTRNEVVREVECKNCTMQAEITEQEFEKSLRNQLIERLLSRRTMGANKSTDSKEEETLKQLQYELSAIESRLQYLQRCSPDDDKPLLAMSVGDSLGDEQEQEPIKLKRSDAIKCLILTRLPAILSIHVQRRYFDQVSGRTSKTLQHVVFPEVLDVSPFCAYNGELRPEAPFAGTVATKPNSKARAPINYKLMAIIEHLGGPNSGHYVSYRRDPSSDSQWLWISDDKVRSCDWSTVRNCQAYMLFYEAM